MNAAPAPGPPATAATVSMGHLSLRCRHGTRDPAHKVSQYPENEPLFRWVRSPGGRHGAVRPGDEEPLQELAAELGQGVPLALGLDPLADDADALVAAHLEDAGHGAALGVDLVEVAHQRH